VTPWWWLPIAVVVCLVAFSLYAFWTAVFQPQGVFGPYLSPFYSPQVWISGPISPAIWVVWAPLVFRGSCYYYRKSYYRSFFRDPVACARPDGGKYSGETSFPFILNNLHRYTMYVALVVLLFLWWDAINAFTWNGHFYLGVGSLIMLINVVLLSAYTLGCHALRHWVGGGLDCYSCARGGQARHGLWKLVTDLNERHAFWAWVSMFSVAGVDIYIRLLQNGWLVDHCLVCT
jgi:hypothetical protein